MARMADHQALFALDLGTSKVLAASAELGGDGRIRVTGVGLAPAQGLRRGIVTDLGAAADSVERAVERAQRMAGQGFGLVTLGFSGGSVISANERFGAEVADQDEVSADDVAAVLAAASHAPGEPEREIVHSIPRHFILDGYDGVRDPVGLAAARLEVESHRVSAQPAVLRNAVRAAERAGVRVAGVTLNGLAAAESVTTRDERERGVLVVDLGAGCTDVVVLVGGTPVYTTVVAIGGDLIRNDVAACLHVSLERAETLKVEHGVCDAALADAERTLAVVEPSASGEGRTATELELAEIISARADELMTGVAAALRASGRERELGAGVVLTGGGARLRGMAALTMRMLELPVRIGSPRGCEDLDDLLGSPAYAASVGLLQLAASGARVGPAQAAVAAPRRRRRGRGSWFLRR